MVSSAPNSKAHPSRDGKEEPTMYIGVGTLVLILAVIIIFMMMRGRSRV
jgi:hypothetical protein